MPATGTPDTPYLDRLGGMPPALVFILGCHRSGTTLLYHLLAGTGAFTYPCAYDVIKYDELIRNRVLGTETDVKAALDRELRSNQADRLIDRLPVGADLPEEYRFVLDTGPVDLIRRIKDVVFAPHLTPQTKDKFIELCRKKQFLSGERKPLLLKNPSDFYGNFLNLYDMFPGHKFVILHRHPLRILNSLVVNWDRAFQTQSHYLSLLDPQYASLFGHHPSARSIMRGLIKSRLGSRILFSGIVEGLTYYMAHIHELPAGGFIELRYEDLCREPDRHLAQIGAFLDLELTPNIPSQAIQPRRQGILEVTRRCYAKRAAHLAPYLARFDYPEFPAEDSP